MTVAAVIVPESLDQALADATGRASVRRIVDAAWAGGALPIVIVAPDPDGRLAAVLEGSPAVIVDPGRASGAESYKLGAGAASERVIETTAVLLWPGRMTWTDPETVTSLIEAHGQDGEATIRPQRGERVGWPVLLPLTQVDPVLAGRGGTIEAAVDEVDAAPLELGDPGSVLGSEVALDELPPYDGPPEPVGGPPPDWGAAAAETPERGLGEG
jgi:CTP:molybdopterin cytidylyltransferase MocA